MSVNMKALKKEAIEVGLRSGIFTRFSTIGYIASSTRLTGDDENNFQIIDEAVAKIGDILPEIKAIRDELSRKG